MSTKNKPKYTRIAQLKTAEQFKEHLSSVEAKMPFEETLENGNNVIFGQSHTLKNGFTIGNKMCILPMEGWDGTIDGKPTEFTKRRWRNFAISGAKLLWGCEAVAVNPTARANPLQIMLNEANFQDFVDLYNMLIEEHGAKFGTTEDLLIGLQLTHSGRFCKPFD